MNRIIGHDTFGSGSSGVIVLNDWLCDTSTWDGARPYLDAGRSTWAFADLRGYGRSRGMEGAFTASEAAGDVLALADALGWKRFFIVGHSMSTLVALHLAQTAADRVQRAVVVSPPPPGGFGADAATLASMQAVARGDDAKRLAILKHMWGARLSDAWIRFKADKWRDTADAEAVAGYVLMFARDGMPDAKTPITIPVLAVTCENDAPHMRRDAVTQALTPLCERLTVHSLTDSGHYPMQESPPLLATVVGRFVADDSPTP
jgi:pimeloyl-ACP methyl ester carboxylesterase